MRKNFQHIIREMCVFFLKQGKKSIPLEQIKQYLIIKENVKSLAYPHLASSYLKTILEVAKTLGYGYYTGESQMFHINPEMVDVLLRDPESNPSENGSL